MARIKTFAALIAAAMLQGPAVASEGELDFVSYMTRIQYFAHKLGLALDAGNIRLADFYLHEVEEIVEALEEVEDFKGVPVAKLVDNTLEPAVERMEKAVDEGDRSAIDAAYEGLLGSCNNCHDAAEYGFIHVERRRDNPYIQSFAPTP